MQINGGRVKSHTTHLEIQFWGRLAAKIKGDYIRFWISPVLLQEDIFPLLNLKLIHDLNYSIYFSLIYPVFISYKNGGKLSIKHHAA